MAFAVLTKRMSSRDSEGTDPGGRTELTKDGDTSEAPRLTAFWDGGSLSRILPASGSLTIGRSSACDVRIEHSSVSRKHAVLHLGTVHRIEDAGSANGTRIAGRSVTSMPVPVAPGEVIETSVAITYG